jgi:exopolyphosphatase / guanosine-5'-triphosphate,3'-diphosphate pyrophosphatase
MMTADPRQPQVVAAIDLGSNSFHMIVARLDEAGTLSVIDRLREPVRLGGGLNKKGRLSSAARQRGLETLERFAQRLSSLPQGSVRIVGTNTLRVASNSAKFVDEAERILGHPIEIIAGREEARLIYLGVAHGRETREGNRLVVDIGGGSTELIIGEGLQSHFRESLLAGCVSSSRRFFGDGEIAREQMRRAVMEARLAVYPVASRFWADNWDEAIGCSGTIKAIRNIAHAEGWSDSGVTRDSLYRLRDAMLAAGHIDRLQLQTLEEDRRAVLPGGLAVLLGVFETLDIETMRVSEQSLREGLLYDLVGRINHADVRASSVKSAASRWSVDQQQAQRVAVSADRLFKNARKQWQLDDDARGLLSWAAHLHEIGLQVSHGQYHKHGAYILFNADLPGFSRQEQALLATLVLNHRRKFRKATFARLTERCRSQGMRLCILLRLAVLLHRGRTEEHHPTVALEVSAQQVKLQFPAGWLGDHPLTLCDLENEQHYLKKSGFILEFS